MSKKNFRLTLYLYIQYITNIKNYISTQQEPVDICIIRFPDL